jgi:hypothetical protein
MRDAKTKGALLHILADEVGAYHLRDLELMNARFQQKVENLPVNYRDHLL